nr:MAG TPA: hypothetical protein [Caudoviricetes sp.]
MRLFDGEFLRDFFVFHLCFQRDDDFARQTFERHLAVVLHLRLQAGEGVLVGTHDGFLLFVCAEDGGVFRVLAHGFGGRQAELADDVLGARAGEGGVQDAAAVRHEVFLAALAVVQVAADAVASEVGADVERLAADRREAADAAADGAAGEIDVKGDAAVFGIAVDDRARVVRAAAGRHGGVGRRLEDVEMAVAVAGRVVAAEAGVGEVAVEDLAAAGGGVAVCAVAAVQVIGAAAVSAGDGGAVATAAHVREVALDVIAVGACGGGDHAV